MSEPKKDKISELGPLSDAIAEFAIRKRQVETKPEAPAPQVTCPDCGAAMTLRETRKFTTKRGEPKKFYGCSRFPACRAVHGAHPDGRPLGVPGNAETKAARMKAHAAFDALCQRRGWGETAKEAGNGAYSWLAKKMNLTRETCHIGMFDVEACAKVEAICQNAR